MINFRLSGVILMSVLLIGCTPYQSQNTQIPSDPLEGFNRIMFNLNYNIFDYYLFHPAAIAWQNYVPKPMRNGLNNFFSNLEEPTTMVNYFIQGKPYKALVHFNRFFVNTMLGFGGFIDVASKANPELGKEDSQRFGSTLGHYGISYGPYLHLPIYSSFTFREDIGGFVDSLYPLLSCLTWWMFTVKWILQRLETRTQLLNLDDFLSNSEDPYVVVRDLYFQRHNFLVNRDVLTYESTQNTVAIEGDLHTIDVQ